MPAPKCRHGCLQSGNARFEIHPFADGNSRSQYELFRRIAFRSGWNIDTARVDLAALSAARYVTAKSGDSRATVVRKELFGGAASDEAVTQPQDGRVVHDQCGPVVQRRTVLLRLCDFVPRHRIPS